MLHSKFFLAGGISYATRASIHINFGVCNKKRNHFCESDEKARKLLELISITQNTIIGRVQLRNYDDPSGIPVSYMNWLYHKLKLSFDHYIDHNNFVILN